MQHLPLLHPIRYFHPIEYGFGGGEAGCVEGNFANRIYSRVNQ
jgi:hypothetical protein